MKVLGFVMVMWMAACAIDDASPDPGADAGSATDESPCCAFGDDDARACMLEQPDRPPSGTCGVLLCRRDSGIARINFCVP